MDNGITTLEIKCRGAATSSLDELVELQGELKDLSEENYVKLRNSITEYGFSFPIFIWQDPEGIKRILDGHQRVRTLLRWREEGLQVPPLPVDFIFADDKTQAKKKLLLGLSRYGKIQREGFDAFVDEVGYEIDESLEDLLVIPEITVYTGAGSDEEEDKGFAKTPQEVICPNCSHKFTM